MTYDHLLDAINMWPRHYFVSARSVDINADGELVPVALYNRFPIGGRLLLHLATSPFDDPWMKVRVARTLMIGFFFGAATLACLALTALRIDRWAAVAATLLAFGSSYHFAYHDICRMDARCALGAISACRRSHVAERVDQWFRHVV